MPHAGLPHSIQPTGETQLLLRASSASANRSGASLAGGRSPAPGSGGNRPERAGRCVRAGPCARPTPGSPSRAGRRCGCALALRPCAARLLCRNPRPRRPACWATIDWPGYARPEPHGAAAGCTRGGSCPASFAPATVPRPPCSVHAPANRKTAPPCLASGDGAGRKNGGARYGLAVAGRMSSTSTHWVG
jgi:hypothetical protein